MEMRRLHSPAAGRPVGVIPGAEIVQFGADLLASVAGGVGGEWKLGVGFCRLAWLRGRGRMTLGHGNTPQNRVAVATVGTVATLRQLFQWKVL
jgi:hypothetical protein